MCMCVCVCFQEEDHSGVETGMVKVFKIFFSAL